jgi:hypothetical protein
MLTRHKKIAAVAIAIILLLCAAGYGGFRGYQKHTVQTKTTAWVGDAGNRLQMALQADPRVTSSDEPATLKLLDGHVEVVARNLAALRAMNSTAQRPLVDDTDHFLLAVREILRQYAASRRHRYYTQIGMRELWEHMGSRYSQGAGWSTEAVRRKDLLEREFFHYRNTTDALVRLLDSYPELRARIASLMDARQLPEEAVTRTAGEHAAEAVKQMAVEMDKLRKLPRP